MPSTIFFEYLAQHNEFVSRIEVMGQGVQTGEWCRSTCGWLLVSGMFLKTEMWAQETVLGHAGQNNVSMNNSDHESLLLALTDCQSSSLDTSMGGCEV
jgi:hypothetical protein